MPGRIAVTGVSGRTRMTRIFRVRDLPVMVMLVDNVTVSLHRSGMAQFVRFANGGQHGLQHQAQRQHGQKSHARECVRECRATGHEAPRYRHP